MKTQTMLLIAAGLGVGYYMYTKSKATQSMSVLGADGSTPTTVQADGNMTPAEIATTQTQWNNANTSNDMAGANQVIANLKAANHPVAAASLQQIITTAQAQNTQANGYSAGAFPLRPIAQLPSLGHPLVHIHRLARVGRI
jgi:hypothetical protein